MPTSNTLEFNFLIFKPAEQRKQSRQVAGLLLTAVAALHLALALYLLNTPKTKPEKPPVVMEIVMLPAPEPLVKTSTKEAPPAPPAKKEPVNPKPVVKKPPAPVKKPAEVIKPKPKPQPAAIADVIPAAVVEPAPPVVTPTPAVAPAATANLPASAKVVEPNAGKAVVSGVVEIICVPPKYPARAASRHIEGWVKVEFTVQTDGSVDDAVVVGSAPEDIFDDAALTAISKCKFKEKLVDGVAVTQRAVKKLQFRLEN